MKNAADDKNAPQNGSSSANENDSRLKLLPFEQNLMVENFISDVLFIVARGLALERLFFNHLHLYSDPASTFFVINTTAEDEHFFLDKLRTHNPDCPPKLITADVLGKDREVIYRSGGVQFITSRILMVDLLTDRVPFDKVGGILVYRAHELLSGFQESFCLRLFREKKKNGIIKAFTDSPLYIVGQGAIGQLQRLANLLYIRRVVILPRFHEEVKACFEENPPRLTQMSIKLEQAQRKSQACLRDIIATCVRELKQCTKDFDAESQSDALTPAATLRPTKLELDLKRRDCPMTERQQRLLNDLHTLRALFYKVEDLDPTQALNFISFLRSNVEVIENNSGWLFTQSAGTLFASIDALCSLKDTDGNRTISPPSKWPVFCTILEEINAKLVSENSDSPVLVLVSNEQLARQLIDLVKFGQRRYVWMVARKMVEPSQRESLSLAPPIQPLWNPVNIACYDAQLFEKDRLDLRTNLKIAQKEETKKARKRNKFMELKDPKQPRLDQFGIQPFARHKGAKRSSKLVAEMGVFKRRGSRAEITGVTAKSQTFPLCREIVPPGMMPEDPFTEFYAGKEETEKKQKKNEGEEDNNGQKDEEEEIILLDNDFPEILESEGDESSNGATAQFPVRHFQRERTPPPLNRSIAGAARERANRSIHIIDEFQRTQDEAELAQQLADPDAQFFPSDIAATTFNKSLKSMLIFLELGSRYRLQTCLESLRPKNVIMYSQDIAATRAIETYKAINADEPLDLFVLMYEESSEEERYLASIQRENDAIEALIKEQGLLMVPREFDVSRDSVSQLRRLTMPTKRADSRRTTNGDENIEEEMRQKVIVDMREFNSELPTVLYRRGVDLVAATLEVGDYILSPQICCERKSLDDLAQSLENGRLFKQVEQMTKHYKKCILLVESTEKYRSRVVRLGAFQGELSRRGRELRSLLALLIRQFPQLIILWSVSPSHSAELFEELKLDQQNPSLEEALAKKRTRPENDNGALIIDDETQIAGEMTTGAD